MVAFSQGNWYCFDIVHMVLDFGMSALFKEQETCACCKLLSYYDGQISKVSCWYQCYTG